MKCPECGLDQHYKTRQCRCGYEFEAWKLGVNSPEKREEAKGGLVRLYFKVWKDFTNYSGRSTRSEYWTFDIVNWVIIIGIVYASILTRGPNPAVDDHTSDPLFWVYVGFLAITIPPELAARVRRLHDSGKSGLWALIAGVPIIGWIVMVILLLLGSDKGWNQYGPNPQGVSQYFE